MAVKASRYLSHVRRLRDPAEPVTRLLGAAAALGPKLGPVLLQLPPTLKAAPALLDACLTEFRRARLPGRRRVRVVVEPRHDSWWTEEVRQILAAHDAALCWADRLGRPVTPLWVTAGWGYLRFHEGTADPWPSYAEQDLRSWAERVRQAWPGGRGRVRLLQQRPGRSRRGRLRHVRGAGPRRRPHRDPDATSGQRSAHHGHPDVVTTAVRPSPLNFRSCRVAPALADWAST